MKAINKIFAFKKEFVPVNESIEVEVFDFEGPVPTQAVKYFDYYLVVSWVFVVFVMCDQLLRKTRLGCWVLEGIKWLTTDTRQRQLPANVERHMILNGADHPHND